MIGIVYTDWGLGIGIAAWGFALEIRFGIGDVDWGLRLVIGMGVGIGNLDGGS